MVMNVTSRFGSFPVFEDLASLQGYLSIAVSLAVEWDWGIPVENGLEVGV